LKRERIRRRTYLTPEAARQDVFEYIDMFYNPKRKHTNNGMLSPVGFEIQQQKLNDAGVWETTGTSTPVQTVAFIAPTELSMECDFCNRMHSLLGLCPTRC
jgi:hypothetical protein